MTGAAGPERGPIRTLLITSGDPLAGVACAGLFERGSGLALAGVLRPRLSARARWRILGAARREGALYYAAYMLAEMHLPRLSGPAATPIARTARRAGAPTLETREMNGPEAIDFARGVGADVALSVRPGAIFRGRLIEGLPPILNLHGSLLPDFRGIAGVLQALAAGRETLGCSVHLVTDERVDRGDIAAQTPFQAVPGRSVYAHSLALYRLGPRTLREAALATAAGWPPHPSRGGSYFSWPDRATLRRLRAGGRRLVEPRDLTDLLPLETGADEPAGA